MPPPSAFGLPPRTPLNKMLEHFSDAVRVVRFADGRPARLQAVVPREVTLGLCAPTADKLPDAAAAHANTNATAAATADAAADLLPTVAPPAAASLAVAPPAAAPRLRLRVAPASATTVSISLTAAIIDLVLAPPATAATAATTAAPASKRAALKCLPSWFDRCLPSGSPVKNPHGLDEVYASSASAASTASATAASAALAEAATTDAAAAVSPVIIVGGGIGGLAAAVALQVRGIPCVVYGASPVTLCPCLQPIGARHPVRRLRA